MPTSSSWVLAATWCDVYGLWTLQMLWSVVYPKVLIMKDRVVLLSIYQFSFTKLLLEGNLPVEYHFPLKTKIKVKSPDSSCKVFLVWLLFLQDCITVYKEPSTGGYGLRDTGSGWYSSRDGGYRSYSHLLPSSYSSSISSQSLDDYGPPGLGGYSRYRL